MPKVSVIIPVYNVEKYLGECLESILGQTLRDIEVLCVDDGSTDGSANILADYAAKDSRVRLFSSPHAGAFRAREVGVKAARGEYTYFMDADDLLVQDAFADLCGQADQDHLDQVVFASAVFCEDDVADGLRRWARRMERYYSIASTCCGKIMDGMALMQSLLEHDSFHVSPPLRLIRSAVVRDNAYPFPDATTRADNYFTPLSLHYSQRALAVPGRYYLRRVRNGSISTSPESIRRHARNLLAVLLALYRFDPFRRPLRDPTSSLSLFAAKLSVAMYGKAWTLPADERISVLAEVMSSATPDECAFVLQVQMTAMRELKRRPIPEIGSLSKSLLRCLWRRACGRAGSPVLIR